MSQRRARGPGSQAALPPAKKIATQKGQGQVQAAHAQLLPEHKGALWALFLDRSYMPEDACTTFLAQIAGSDAVYALALRELNEHLAKGMGLRLKTIKNPVDGKKYVGLANLIADPPPIGGTTFSIPQRDFFRAVIECIATSQPGGGPVDHPGAPFAPSMALLNLEVRPAATLALVESTQGQGTQAAAGKKSTKLSLHDRNQTLRELVATGWLASKPGAPEFYCLGPRTLLELGDYLLGLDLADATKAAWEEVL